MGFGKRTRPPGKSPIPGLELSPRVVDQPAFSPPPVQSTSEQRILDLRQTFLRLLKESGNIAIAVRENGSIAMRGMDEDVDPLGPPLSVRGFREHFTHTAKGENVRSAFVYCDAPAMGALDPAAQLHLQSLLAQIMDLNRYCQQAYKDDALGVALQSPAFPVRIDRIIAGTAFFAGFFERVALARPYFGASPMRALPMSEMARLADSAERHRLMAIDVMLAPATFGELVPRSGAAVGIETTWTAHAGEKIVNEVYFPADGATPRAA